MNTSKDLMQFVIDYKEYINNLYKNTNINQYSKNKPKHKFISKKTIDQSTIKPWNSLKERYNNFINYFSNINDKDFLVFLIEYIKFCNYMEKCFFYKNDDIVIANWDLDNRNYELIVDLLDVCKITYQFQKSEINISNNNSLLADYVNNIKEKEETVTFVNIEIERNSNYQSGFNNDINVSSFKTIIGSTPEFSPFYDNLLYDNIQKLTIKQIKNSFDYMLDNLVFGFGTEFNNKELYSVKELLSNAKLCLW